MDEDVSSEPLEAEIDVHEAVMEALSLAIPAFPRAEGAEIGAVVAAPPGAEALTDELSEMVAGDQALVAAVPDPTRRVVRTHLRFFADRMPADFDLRGANVGNRVRAQRQQVRQKVQGEEGRGEGG